MERVHIGIPKETKPFENRVAMTPRGVAVLVAAGARVAVQKNAGLGSGFPDGLYRQAGAKIVTTASQAWEADLVLKVKEPQAPEFRFFRPSLTLFTFLHLAACPLLARALERKKVAAIAYEDVTDAQGGFPILAPMSEIAGCLSTVIGANYLRRDLGGKGTLLPAIGRGGTGHVTILGAGNVGTNALRVAHGMGASVTVFDKNPMRLKVLQNEYTERLQPLNDALELPEVIRRTDLLIGAVLLPGRAAPEVVSEAMVKSMEAGSVIVDVAIDQGGCVATSRATTIRKPIFLKHGVLHYGVTNIPSLVPRTATEALSRATLPYVLKLIAGEKF